MVVIFLGGIFTFSLLGYLLSRLFKRNDLADVLWGLGPLFLLALFFWQQAMAVTPLAFLPFFLFVMVSLWGMRLSFYLFIRLLGKSEEDKRYQHFRIRWGRFEPLYAYAEVYLLQSVLMGIMTLPLLNFFFHWSAVSSLLPTWNHFVGLTLFMIGFLFEAVADYQLFSFKRDVTNKGKVLNSGVWALSRHPNYFGEFLIWWGFFFFTLGVPNALFFIISPLLVSFLLLKVSGVPMLEKLMTAKERGQAQDRYETYRREVPVFFPFRLKDIKQFFKIIFILFALDFLWLGVIMNEFYVRETAHLARILGDKFDPLLWAAALVYFFIPLGVILYAANNKVTSSRSDAFFKGAIWGMILYAVYEFTNLALIKDWPVQMALVDFMWGGLLCGLTAFFSFNRQRVFRE